MTPILEDVDVDVVEKDEEEALSFELLPGVMTTGSSFTLTPEDNNDVDDEDDDIDDVDVRMHP